jgi:altronate hydrolase
MEKQSIVIQPGDTVAVLLEEGSPGDWICVEERRVFLKKKICGGHKVCIVPVKAGEEVRKYGCSIGKATKAICEGDWVHTHNLKSGLTEKEEYTFYPVSAFSLSNRYEDRTFLGYPRKTGRPGIRNELWIIPTVGCVNTIAQGLAAKMQYLVGPGIDGVYAFPHPYGCSQLGEDHENTRRILATLASHPNAGGVLILGLGCENNTMESFQKLLPEERERIRFLVCQDCEDEWEAAETLLTELAQKMKQERRMPFPLSELAIGLKCGGSDGFSGITGNPLAGRISDLLIGAGGSAILTEVPEMFGAEQILMNRCRDQKLFEELVDLIQSFKDYYTAHGQNVYENPSPGNKAGGITTLEEKSLGCVQKGGFAPVTEVLAYGSSAFRKGLSILGGPGNDLVAVTALAASGAQMILFTTGRGTPLGSPVPVVKISTHTELKEKKPGWIDFDAGRLLKGISMEELAWEGMEYLIRVASGEKTHSEKGIVRDFSIFKSGVTL